MELWNVALEAEPRDEGLRVDGRKKDGVGAATIQTCLGWSMFCLWGGRESAGRLGSVQVLGVGCVLVRMMGIIRGARHIPSEECVRSEAASWMEGK